MEDPSSYLLLGNISKEPFDHIEPRSAGWRIVHVEPWMLREPVPDRGVLVGGIIIGNQVKFFLLRGDPVQDLEKCEPFDVTVSWHAGRCSHASIERVERGEERG